MDSGERQALRVHFAGHVQGVGFRYTTFQIAQGYDVTGDVENLPDGRVRMVAEGMPDVINDFVGEIRRRMGGFIHQVQQDDIPPTGRYVDFQIRH